MEIKKLKTASLADALKDMTIGETCVAPDGYQPKSVTKTCVELKEQGYLFQTSTRSGVQCKYSLKSGPVSHSKMGHPRERTKLLK